jgi:ribosomal protein S18 acetylase RimI-like enzyme
MTHAEHRRNGLGRSVLTAALNAAWEANWYKVMVASGRYERTLRFYDKIGFRRGGKTFFEIRRLQGA